MASCSGVGAGRGSAGWGLACAGALGGLRGAEAAGGGGDCASILREAALRSSTEAAASREGGVEENREMGMRNLTFFART